MTFIPDPGVDPIHDLEQRVRDLQRELAARQLDAEDLKVKTRQLIELEQENEQQRSLLEACREALKAFLSAVDPPPAGAPDMSQEQVLEWLGRLLAASFHHPECDPGLRGLRARKCHPDCVVPPQGEPSMTTDAVHDLESGFHNRDGWYFRRDSAEGHVRLWKVRWEDGRPVLEAGPHVIPENEWASIVASVSGAGETGESWSAIREYHATGYRR